MNNKPLVELVDVDHQSRSGDMIIRGATLQVRRGETVAIRGIARSGKTTLLRLLAGVVAPTRGMLRYGGGETRTECGIEGLFRSEGVAFLSQRPSYLLGLTALEHIMVGLFARGLRDESLVKTMAARGLAESNATRMSSILLCELSPGNRRLVLVAEALALDSSLVFVDEGYGASIGTLVSPRRTLVIASSTDVAVPVDRTFAIDRHGIVHVLEPEVAPHSNAPNATEAA
ncbi:MAG: Fe(3+)-transporting ATPase [Labilithrix sp.]|nr:Fe(3+)-transporting ATPase [Labilithrix sp.]